MELASPAKNQVSRGYSATKLAFLTLMQMIAAFSTMDVALPVETLISAAFSVTYQISAKFLMMEVAFSTAEAAFGHQTYSIRKHFTQCLG